MPAKGGGNFIKTTSASSSTGAITLSASAFDGLHQAFPAALDGLRVSYRIDHSSIQTQWEVGEGVYTHSTLMLTRPAANAHGSAGAGVNTDFDTGGLVVEVVVRWEDLVELNDDALYLDHYGAVGDGSTDDTAAINAAVAAMLSTGKELRGTPGKTYYLASSPAAIVPPEGSTIRMRDIHIKAPNQVSPWRFQPATPSQNSTLTGLSSVQILGNSNLSTRVALTSTTGLAVGDWVMVGSSTDQWPAGSQPIWFETAQIVRLTTDTSIDLHRRLLGEKTGLLANNLVLFRIPLYAALLDNLSCECDGDPFATGQTDRRYFIELRFGANHQLENCWADDWWHRLIVNFCTANARIDSLKWQRLPDITNPSTEALGYGVQDIAACYGTQVRGLQGGICRHAYTNDGLGDAYSSSTPWLYGMPTAAQIVASHVTGCGAAAYDTHEEGIDTSFIAVESSDPVHQPNTDAGTPCGFQLRGYGDTINGAVVRGGFHGVRDNGGQSDWGSLPENTHKISGLDVAHLEGAGIFFQGNNDGTTILVEGYNVSDTVYAFQSGTSDPFAGDLAARGVVSQAGTLYLDGGATGIVSIGPDDAEISAAASATNYTPSAATVEGHLAGIDAELGTMLVVADEGIFTPTAIDLSAAAYWSEYSYTQSGAVVLAASGGTPNGGQGAQVNWIGDGSNITCGSGVEWSDGTTGAKSWSGLQLIMFIYSDDRGKYIAVAPGATLGVGDMLANIYDPNTVAGDAFDMDNMVEGTTNKILTAAERTLIASALQPSAISTSTHSGSGNLAIDLSAGRTFVVTVDANITGLALSNIPDTTARTEIRVVLIQGSGGGATVDLTGGTNGVAWSDGQAPPLPAVADSEMELVVWFNGSPSSTPAMEKASLIHRYSA